MIILGNMILLKKYEPGCVFCGDMKIEKTLCEKHICEDCIKDLKNKK